MHSPTNNLMSNLMHNQVGTTPAVGVGITVCSWTDRWVGTIVQVFDDNSFLATQDSTTAELSKPRGMGHQDWIHTENPTAKPFMVKKGRDGRWYIARKSTKGNYTVNKKCTPVAVGRKDYYHDWSF